MTQYEFKKIQGVWYRRALKPKATWEKLHIEHETTRRIKVRRRSGDEIIEEKAVPKMVWEARKK